MISKERIIVVVASLLGLFAMGGGIHFFNVAKASGAPHQMRENKKAPSTPGTKKLIGTVFAHACLDSPHRG